MNHRKFSQCCHFGTAKKWRVVRAIPNYVTITIKKIMFVVGKSNKKKRFTKKFPVLSFWHFEKMADSTGHLKLGSYRNKK